MRCSSARASARCSSPRAASATRSRSATRRGRTSSQAHRQAGDALRARRRGRRARARRRHGRERSRISRRCARELGRRSATASMRSRSSSCTPIAIPRTSSAWPRSRARWDFAQVSVEPRGLAADQARRPRRHHRRRRVSLADPAPLCRAGGARSQRKGHERFYRRKGDAAAPAAAQRERGAGSRRRSPPHVHDVVRRADRRGIVPGQGRDPVRTGRRRRRHGARAGARPASTHVIGFDMGGTSTDVSHFDGEYERAFETEVAGVRMRAPMMLHPHGGGRRRLDPALRRRTLPRRAGQRRRQSRPDVLSPRRPARPSPTPT